MKIIAKLTFQLAQLFQPELILIFDKVSLYTAKIYN